MSEYPRYPLEGEPSQQTDQERKYWGTAISIALIVLFGHGAMAAWAAHDIVWGFVLLIPVILLARWIVGPRPPDQHEGHTDP